jgi:hypothetical protein
LQHGSRRRLGRGRRSRLATDERECKQKKNDNSPWGGRAHRSILPSQRPFSFEDRFEGGLRLFRQMIGLSV